MQVKSRARVADYGEVFTSEREVNAMLDLVKQETERIDSRFLEPACGTGNFLIEILRRKLKVVCSRYKKSQIEYEKYAFLAVSSVYGIDLLEDNVIECRQRLYDLFNNDYFNLYKKKCNESCRKTIQFLLSKNIICGDTLTLKTNKGEPIIFSEWSLVSDNLVKRRDFSFSEILDGHNKQTSLSFFNDGAEYDKENKMRFDVIIGNPPYQLSDGGAQKSATPIYNKFVETAIKLNPRYITMIIPARWYSGGKGLDDFREMLIKDRRMSILHDFPDTSECFSGLNIRGGVCYFLWDKTHSGDCIVYNHNPGKEIDSLKRPLLSDKEESVFIRFNKAIPILSKVRAFGEKKMDTMVSPRKPFGLPTNFIDFKNEKDDVNNILLYRFGNNGYVSIAQIPKNKELINKYKVLIPYSSTGGDEYPHLVLTKPILAGKGSICTETYLTITPIESEEIGENVMSYMRTRFFRFLLLLLKNSQHLTQKTYSLVPVQNFTESWTDEKLYAKYGITDDEIKYIESLIRPLDK